MELLVVLCIIMILVGMLLPALAKARDEARKVECRQEMRSVLAAVLMYMTDNKGRMPALSELVIGDEPANEARCNTGGCVFTYSLIAMSNDEVKVMPEWVLRNEFLGSYVDDDDRVKWFVLAHVHINDEKKSVIALNDHEHESVDIGAVALAAAEAREKKKADPEGGAKKPAEDIDNAADRAAGG
ncbi:MAG: hypothetical protein ISS36_04230 [Candidatus Aenigmarchaeota archaeon]|nr:hypothetical protein [Candidatus Aenigmarchaeota archaeon]